MTSESKSHHDYVESSPDLKLSHLLDLMHTLHLNYQVRLDQLDTQLERTLQSFREEVREVRSDRPDIFSSLVHEFNRLPRPTSIESGTIGSYLYGCEQADFGDVPDNCAPACMNSFSTNLTSTNCPYQIWHLFKDADSDFTFLRSPSTMNDYPNEALIYVSDDFVGLTTRQINLLRDSYVDTITILIQRNSRYIRVLPPTDINQLPPHLIVNGDHWDKNGLAIATDEVPTRRPSYLPSIGNIFDRDDNERSSGGYLTIVLSIVVLIVVLLIIRRLS